MKAFAIETYGKTSPVLPLDLPEPALTPGDVRVRIEAAALNVLDSKIRDGAFKAFLPYKMPLILGNDLAGIVTELGAGATRFAVGDRVYGRPDDRRIGTLAESICVAETDLARAPGNVSVEEAASLPLVALTAWQALVERAKVKPGQKVFIHAGSGGVGTVAIQLAKHLGATVATTCSTRNIDLVKSLGADVAIDYTKQDFAKELSGYDVVLNSLDAKTLHRSLDVLKPGGHLVSISGPPDPAFADERRLGFVLTTVFRALSFGIRRAARKAGVHYSFLFMRADGRQLADITKLVEAGVIKPVIDRIFPFEQTHEALAYLERGSARGKIVVSIGEA
ncbi:NADP-dependent oxidoreductase [Aminobacter sp. BA135]|uniref:NADP-dependent oxidoreductase n=1 Tax=Aminobacter sp. BA135 TaxID=537596 RepID=UPI003D7ACD88